MKDQKIFVILRQNENQNFPHMSNSGKYYNHYLELDYMF